MPFLMKIPERNTAAVQLQYRDTAPLYARGYGMLEYACFFSLTVQT